MRNSVIAVVALALLCAGGVYQQSSVHGDAPVAKSWPSIPMHMLDSTVMVSTDFGHGSGVCVGEGIFLTACHVVTDRDNKIQKGIYVEIHTRDHNGEFQIEAEVIAHDIERDVAVLKTKVAHRSIASLGNEEDVQVGDALFTIGAPGSAHKNTATLGYLAEKHNRATTTGDPLLWQSSNAVWFGNSGGPVFDANTGLLIGLAVQVTGHPGAGWAPNCCFFVSLDIIKALLKEAK